MRKLGQTLPPAVPLPTPLFRTALPALRTILPGRHQRALAGLPLFLDYLEERQEFCNAETTKLLEGAGISRPALKDFLDGLINFYFARPPRL